MSEALTPTQVAQRLAELSRMLNAAQAELTVADEKAVLARQRYEVTFARALIGAQASNGEARKAQATLDSEKEKLDSEIADMQVRALKTRLSVLRDQVDIGRSLGAAIRSEWAATP